MKCKEEGCNRTDIKSKKLGLCSIHYARWYRRTHKEQIRPGARVRYLRNRERNLENSKKWAKKHPERVKKSKVKYANGCEEYKRLERIRGLTRYHFTHLKDTTPCQICGSREQLEFHHSRPYDYRNFIIICSECHEKIENELSPKRIKVNRCSFSQNEVNK